MKLDHDPHRDIWGPAFTQTLHFWGEQIWTPMLPLIENNQIELAKEGNKPNSFPIKKESPIFHFKQLNTDNEGANPTVPEIKYFDLCADEYEMAVHPFKSPILKRSYQILSELITENATILDCACGPGFESIQLANMANKGTVVGIDLSEQMIRQAKKNVRQHELSNVHFFYQAAEFVRLEWEGVFDVVFCQLSISYFANMSTVAKMMKHALGHQGTIVLIEPVPNKENALSIEGHRMAIPLFKQYYDFDTLKDIYKEQGFRTFYFEELLPGIGLYLFSL